MYVAFIEPCFGIGHNLSLICQMTSEDIKHQLIIMIHTNEMIQNLCNKLSNCSVICKVYVL